MHQIQIVLRRLVFPPALKTLVFLPVAAVLGAHLIAITNGARVFSAGGKTSLRRNETVNLSLVNGNKERGAVSAIDK
jgi:hypothetical protein